jgi:hypothetical protein
MRFILINTLFNSSIFPLRVALMSITYQKNYISCSTGAVGNNDKNRTESEKQI